MTIDRVDRLRAAAADAAVLGMPTSRERNEPKYLYQPAVERFNELDRFSLHVETVGVAWKQDAACRGMDPDIFFPGRGDHADAKIKSICATCNVTAECEAYGIASSLNQGRPLGWWGGKSAKTLRQITLERRTSA